MQTRIITIDGPAGAGKTTVSKALAQRLGCIYVDTGALYRGVAWEIKAQGIDWTDDEKLKPFLATLDLKFTMKDKAFVLTSSGRDISGFIRTPDISMLASSTSANPAVRQALLGIQHSIGACHDAVFEGRDMGTVVFPEADYKFFLVADLSVRARRRYDELTEDQKDIDTVAEQMKRRDTNDSSRKTAPLKPADDAVEIDSSQMTVEQVVDKMISIIEKA